MNASRQPENLAKWREQGWILEPDTLQILRQGGLDVVEHCRALSIEEAVKFARATGFPLVAKVVSPAIMHKSDVGGVATGITSEQELAEHFDRFSRMEGFAGMLVARMIAGTELILGAKIDGQFGPVVLLGIGGTGVEIYGDVAIRMAPLTREDVPAMAASLEGHKLLEGFRRQDPVNIAELTTTVLHFSELVMKYRDQIESADINPLICSAKKCIVADGRIILKKAE
ncbi:MAG: acetate--CoA ligase family protein [Desulfobulbaceae bacterium]|nr:acetate--CoA ligase family protein [Desulfobulbaceae bacterium]